ncbi:hypothetical protein BBC27_05630 [Acidithiobacillus ferrivorans]|uniref:Uncharacterized protein n=1 Tax=Acidithiobacillus ferrivorans TaxID=160808 RepID=A0A1B9C1T7_9PROT|nr:hypothetical protein [Acidithiobacillus ferrivorans]OCB03936.1 hypothetical protein BBC27_05630 [Acidithiobacillus ferrivorans]
MNYRFITMICAIAIGTSLVALQADAATTGSMMGAAPSTTTQQHQSMAQMKAHLQHEQIEQRQMMKREAYLKAHKNGKAAAMETKRIHAGKAEIVKLKHEIASVKAKTTQN